MRQGTLLLLFLFAIRAPAGATTIIAPRDLGELALSSDAVVLARALSSAASRRGVLIFTRTDFVVEEPLSGGLPPSGSISVEVPGGGLGEERWLVPGSPRFEEGESYLLFLMEAGGTWRPALSSYGLMRSAIGSARRELLVPLPEARLTGGLPASTGGLRERIGPYWKERTLERLKQVLRRESGWSSTGLEPPAEEVPQTLLVEPLVSECSFLRTGNGLGFRWRTFDSGGTATIRAASPGGPSAGQLRLMSEAMDLWMRIDGTSMNLAVGGTARPDVTCTRMDDLAANLVLFDDPCADIAALRQCGGVLAFGGPLGTGTHQFNGEAWVTISGWAVVVNDGAECLGDDSYRIMLAHELGHGLGFDHVQDSRALMYASCCNDMSSTDSFCAAYAYPAIHPENRRPEVDAGGGPRLISGNQARLQGAASDDGFPGELTAVWRLLHGPGEAAFDDPARLDATARFSASGTYLLALTASDGELLRTDTLLVEVDLDAGPAFRRGDVNGDADLNLADAVYGLNFLFLNGSRPSCLESADVDDSGSLDLADPVYLLGHLFLAGSPPAEPLERCGSDPTADGLACESFAGCE